MSRTSRTADQRHRRFFLGMDIAVGAALIAAMIALAHTARADTDIDPFEDLFYYIGFNAWTPAADASLPATTAASLDTSFDNFQLGFNSFFVTDPLSSWTQIFDPSAFTGDPDIGGLPLNATGDFAVGVDYLMFSSGLTPLWDSVFAGVGLLDLLLGGPAS